MKYKLKIMIDATEEAINAWFEKHPDIEVVSLERKNIDNPVMSGLSGHKNHWIETIIIYTEGK